MRSKAASTVNISDLALRPPILSGGAAPGGDDEKLRPFLPLRAGGRERRRPPFPPPGLRVLDGPGREDRARLERRVELLGARRAVVSAVGEGAEEQLRQGRRHGVGGRRFEGRG